MQVKGHKQDCAKTARPQAARLVRQRGDEGVTRRQIEVLCVLATGMSDREAANFMSISKHTVVRHISNMASRVGARNRLELLAKVIAFGLIDLDHWPPRPARDSSKSP
jgi:DNA-binding CsgD family transcriptional regulator